jgi:hypothetical protein
MDRTGRLGGPAVIDDDAFHESLARLSLHLATRRPTQPPPDLEMPPPRRFRVPWPLVISIALVGAVGYPSYKWLVSDDLPRHPTAPHIAAVTPTPVMAAIAVPSSPRKMIEPPSAPVDVAAAIPAPPPPAPPVSLPEPNSTAAPQPEAALSKAEIVEIQKRLAALGLNPGPIDGVAGTRTVASVRIYEARAGRPVTGKIDRSLLTLLR